MRAVQIRHFGGYEELEVADRPTPVAGPGQVVIRVRAAGVNLADTLIRRNRYAVTPNLPLVLGNEVTGVVHHFGPGVEGIRVGTRVAAPLFFPQGVCGGYADYATVDAGLVVPIPDGLPFDQATALMVQGLTALHLTRQISPRGKRVLVNAAAGESARCSSSWPSAPVPPRSSPPPAPRRSWSWHARSAPMWQWTIPGSIGVL
jgi:NADPH2:quinone reductase